MNGGVELTSPAMFFIVSGDWPWTVGKSAGDHSETWVLQAAELQEMRFVDHGKRMKKREHVRKHYLNNGNIWK